jgi:hypothetical protein
VTQPYTACRMTRPLQIFISCMHPRTWCRCCCCSEPVTGRACENRQHLACNLHAASPDPCMQGWHVRTTNSSRRPHANQPCLHACVGSCSNSTSRERYKHNKNSHAGSFLLHRYTRLHVYYTFCRTAAELAAATMYATGAQQMVKTPRCSR